MNEKVARDRSWRIDPMKSKTEHQSASNAPLAGDARSLAVHGSSPGHETSARMAWGLQRLRRRVQGMFMVRGSTAQDRESPFEAIIEDFVETLSFAVEPSAVAAELAQAAKSLSNAHCVDFMFNTWDEEQADPAPSATAVGTKSRCVDQSISMTLPLNYGGQHWGALKLVGIPEPSPKSDSIGSLDRALTTLCTIAAMALDSISTSQLFDSLGIEPVEDSAILDLGSSSAPGSPFLHDATYLHVILPYALSQAHRHRELVSILYIGIDRLLAIHETLGPEAVNRAVNQIGEIMSRRLRSSDVVSRMEDDRILAMLPNATASDARRIAIDIRAMVEEQCGSLDGLPPLTLSIGVASFPTHAKNVYSLLNVADEAMEIAKQCGRNSVVVAEPPDRS